MRDSSPGRLLGPSVPPSFFPSLVVDRPGTFGVGVVVVPSPPPPLPRLSSLALPLHRGPTPLVPNSRLVAHCRPWNTRRRDRGITCPGSSTRGMSKGGTKEGTKGGIPTQDRARRGNLGEFQSLSLPTPSSVPPNETSHLPPHSSGRCTHRYDPGTSFTPPVCRCPSTIRLPFNAGRTAGGRNRGWVAVAAAAAVATLVAIAGPQRREGQPPRSSPPEGGVHHHIHIRRHMSPHTRGQSPLLLLLSPVRGRAIFKNRYRRLDRRAGIRGSRHRQWIRYRRSTLPGTRHLSHSPRGRLKSCGHLQDRSLAKSVRPIHQLAHSSL